MTSGRVLLMSVLPARGTEGGLRLLLFLEKAFAQLGAMVSAAVAEIADDALFLLVGRLVCAACDDHLPLDAFAQCARREVPLPEKDGRVGRRDRICLVGHDGIMVPPQVLAAGLALLEEDGRDKTILMGADYGKMWLIKFDGRSDRILENYIFHDGAYCTISN